jgi:hypothetical protein
MPGYLDLEVSLVGVEPRIWRRLLMSPKATFGDLHQAIQDACGWLDYHLYEFLEASVAGKKLDSSMQVKCEVIARSEHAEPFDEEDVAPLAGELPLGSYFSEAGDRCFYVYDFGDYWEHLVELKQVEDRPDTFARHLVGGARAFPPEDCGSLPGYEECCEAFAVSDEELMRLKKDDPEMWDEIESRKEWMGDWDPERFDLEAMRTEFDG